MLLLVVLTGKGQVLSYVAPVATDRAPVPEKITALLAQGTIYFNDPYPRMRNLNEAIRLGSEAAVISRKVGIDQFYNDAQLLVAYSYLRKNQPDSAELILGSVNDSTRFKILLGLSHIYRDDENGDRVMVARKALRFALRAKDLSPGLGDSLKKIMAVREIACIHAIEQQSTAEAELLQVITLLNGVGYPYLHYTYFELSLLSFYLGNYDKALNYSQLGLKSMSQTKDSANAADLYFLHGVILRQIGQKEASLDYLKRAIEWYKLQYGDQTMADAVYYYIEVMVKMGRAAEAEKVVTRIYGNYAPDNGTDSVRWFAALGTLYRLRKDYTKALKYSQLRMDLLVRLGKPPDYYYLGQVYVEAGKYASAKPYLEKALSSHQYTYSIRAKAHLEYCLYLADSGMGNYVSAIRHLLQNKRYDDTAMKQSKVEAIQKYEAAFESERKEADLKLKDKQISLLMKEKELKDMNLEKVRFVKNLAIYGSIGLLVVGVLMNIQYRQKRKAGRLVAVMNKQLQRSLAEKEWLLKEVHHRVKNNLHTIICLLESQAMYLEKDALQAIEKSQHRIYAMSLIHQKLYQNDDMQAIDMAVYLEEFVGYLKDSFDTQGIAFVVDVETVRLNLQQAISVALIINEGVTNSIKYAFKDILSPVIRISIALTGERVELVIADNGRGFQVNEENDVKSLGLQLIRGLGKELQGTVRVETSGGTRLIIVFERESIADPIKNMQWTISDYEA